MRYCLLYPEFTKDFETACTEAGYGRWTNNQTIGMTTTDEVETYLKVKAKLMGIDYHHTELWYRQQLCCNAQIEYDYWLKDHPYVFSPTRIMRICQLYLKYLPKE